MEAAGADVHAEHLRRAASFLRWLPAKLPAGLSTPQAAHRMPPVSLLGPTQGPTDKRKVHARLPPHGKPLPGE